MEYDLREVQKMVNQDPRVKKTTKPILIAGGVIALGLVITLVFSLVVLVDSVALVGLALIGLGIIVILGLTLRVIFFQKKVRDEIIVRLKREEEEKLAQIKASMTPAEWESYKIQLENNKLLKDIKKRSSQRSSSTTTYGFTTEG
ncbi:MAG: hypothetical protein ACO3S0_08010 [bacterium]